MDDRARYRLYQGLSQLEREDEWEPYLLANCPDDPVLRQQLLDRRRSATPRSDDAGTIGPYRILSLLGEGGMGAVYLAEQPLPHRHVAVKVIKAGMDTRQVIARFEVEREALAMMDHPNIAAVHAAGATSEGRPYFAMEYVAGVPITDYCDRHQVTTHGRLLLFLQVCAAIQHAHQKGVIHRDIKPSNILVTLVDGRPQPKVIDFGVAKATHQRLTEQTVFTELGHVIGTPGYMSPEQAEMTGLDVDTTTDIYALGVLLYELLVGAMPFDPKRLRAAGYDEIRRIIREEEPARPSTRLSSLGEAATDVARRHNTDVPSLTRQIQGDLDWITLKAMDKDRTRRYASASEFAADLQRHLADEPVLARPAGVAYRARKFVRRHRAAVAGALAATLLLAAFGVAMAAQSRRVAAERDTAARERDRAEAVSAFIASLFEASDPDRSKGEKVSARQLLDQGRQRLDSELVDQPQTRATLLYTIGRVYARLELNDAAESALREALKIQEHATGRDRAGYADSLYELSRLGARVDRYEDQRLIDVVLRIRREVFGPEHASVARAIASQGVAAEGSQPAEAERLYREAIAMAGRVNSLSDQGLMKVNLAGLLVRQSRHPEAIEMLRDAIAQLTRIHGADHSWVQAGLSNLSVSLSWTGRNEEAEPVQREVLRVRRKLYGPENFHVAAALHVLGNTLHALDQRDESEQMLREAVAIHRKVRPGPHDQLAWALSDLAWLLSDRAQYDEAERAYRESIDVFSSAKVPGDATAWSVAGLGYMYYNMRRFTDAERLAREAVRIRVAAKVESGPGYAISKELLARVLCESASSPEGEQHARDALSARQNATPPEPRDIAMAEAILGRCLAAARRFEEAEKLLLGAHPRMVDQRGPRRDNRRYAERALVDLYTAWPRPEQAAAWRAKAPAH